MPSLLSLQTQPAPDIRQLRHWKNVSSAEAAGMLRSGMTVAVGWLGDNLATAMADAYLTQTEPNNLTIVYSATHG